MLKISDILKKTRKKREAKASSVEKKTASRKVGHESEELKRPLLDIKQENSVKLEHAEKEPPLIIPAQNLQIENAENEKVINSYKEAISLSEKMRDISSENWKTFHGSAEKIIDKFINILQSDENTLLRLFFGDYYSFNGYLYQHSVNVCILSLYIFRSLKYSSEDLQQVGLAALLHDVGLIKYDDLISQNKRFGPEEYKEIRKHPITGRDIMEKLRSNISIEILEVISQEHERLDGSGYPNTLEKKDISDKARLIGLVDSYESMMHIRPYRDKFKSEDVIKSFTQHKAGFDYKFLKTLIDLVGVFSIMTLVKLNTKEMGVVIKQNYQMPLKPVVNITHSAQGQKIDSPKAIDLASNFSIYIQECLINHKIKDESNSE